MIRALALLTLLAAPAGAEIVTVVQPVRAGHVIGADDLTFAPGAAEGAFEDPRDVVGLEARVNLYPGRALRPVDVGLPTVIERNATVEIVFRRGGLTITSEGRALGRAGDGETVRVMNLASRSTVTGIATAAGAVVVD